MNMHSYLEIVSEQIRCRRAKQMILEELEGHIEDQKLDYMADGMNADEAEEEAVRQMGDPVETGEIHGPGSSDDGRDLPGRLYIDREVCFPLLDLCHRDQCGL